MHFSCYVFVTIAVKQSVTYTYSTDLAQSQLLAVMFNSLNSSFPVSRNIYAPLLGFAAQY